MKRIIALILAILTVCAVLCACGDNNNKSSAVTTTVKSKYDDGYASRFADSSTKDADGNVTYQFSQEQYDDFKTDYGKSLSADITKDISAQHESTYGEFAYINEQKQAIMIGIHEGEYDEKTAEAEAESVADYGLKYFQNLSVPVDTIRVVYCNANDQSQEFGSFEFKAE